MKKLFYTCLFCFYSAILFCQNKTDIAHYMIYPSLINPAANGSFEYSSAILYGHQQWLSIEGAPARYGLQFVQPIGNISLAASISQENIGVHSKENLFFTYTHKIRFNGDQSVCFGLSPGIEIITSNYNKITTTSGYDEQFLGSKSIVRPDFSSGVYYYTKNIYAGISIPGMIKNSIEINNGELSGQSSIAPSYWHYYILGGYIYNIDDFYSLTFSTLVKKVEHVPADADLNVLLNYNNYIGFGLSYRTQKEMLVFANVNISSALKLGYCFHSYFNVKSHMLAGHEIFISYTYLRSKQATIQSPRF